MYLPPNKDILPEAGIASSESTGGKTIEMKPLRTKINKGKQSKVGFKDASQLTMREHEVLIYISEGLTSQKIADKLFVCVDTIESHRKKIIKKLVVKNIAHAVAYAFRHNLLR